MRLISLAAATVLLALLAVPTPAEDKPKAEDDTPTVKDDTWGYSYTCRGLAEPINPDEWVVAVKASIDEHGKDGELCIEKQTDKLSSEDYLRKLCERVEDGGKWDAIEECKFAGLPAFKARLTYGDEDTRILICTKALAREWFWWVECSCDGKEMSRWLKLANDAINSFKLLKPGEKPEPRKDFHFDTRAGFSIETVGFKGQVEVPKDIRFRGKVAWSAGEESKRKALGGMEISLIRRDYNRAEGMRRARADLEERGVAIESLKEVDICGRQAARFSYSTSQDGIRIINWLSIMIWDDDMVWTIEIWHEAGSTDAKIALEEALNSFKLLKPAPAKAEQPK